MTDSILTTIKKLLGLAEDYTPFDADVIVFINSAFMTLRQLGLGPEAGFSISDSSTTWTDYINDIQLYEPVKEYIYLKVRTMFDPPVNSFVMDAYTQQASELEWRLMVEKDYFQKKETTT